MVILKRFLVITLCTIAAVCAVTTTSGCAPRMKGQTKDDTTLTKTSKELPQTSDVNEYRGPKLRVGVVNFQNKTPSKVLGIGEAAADILGTILQKTDRFIVIPQQDMDSILAQQRMGASGAINPDTAAQMGQVLGLNAIVTGAVTAYSEAEEGSDYLVAKSKKQIARVTVDYRIVDTTTGVQIMADSGAGIYSKSVSRVLGMGSKAGYDPDLRDGALRDALTKAMVNMMQKLGTRRWTGRIAQVDGDSLYINAGQKSGLNVGDKLKIFRAGKDIIDPVTKVKLGTTESPIGEAIVQQNDLGDSADLSIAAPRSGTGFRPGDIVKLAK
ncbi:MAG TPA: CsgG/HfaB family protein [Nitrospirota bacterium]|nr:CsgG/HfaB family protein [Nitrospirota bacterium]